jgi:serine protease Do
MYLWRILPVLLVVSFLSGCISETSVESDSAILQQLIDQTCFEVVVRRVEKDSLSYEQELPWDQVPFRIRTDDYLPLGTAFAVSESEFATAAHVLHLMDNSRLYPDTYIRDTSGMVYPIDKVLSFHAQKDFAIFSVEGKQNRQSLNLKESFDYNEPIFAIGDIYGQGIVAVPGNILGTIPEHREGKWSYIKSSPPNGEGSSGGPLLDADLNVVGIITGKDENFSYSLPIAEVGNSQKSTGIFDEKISFRFYLMPQKNFGPTHFNLEIELPKPLKEIRNTAHSEYVDHCQKGMDDFFAKYSDEMFPTGKNAANVLQDYCGAGGVQFVFNDSDDNTWYFSNLEKESSSLADNGRVFYAMSAPAIWLDLVKPEKITHEQLYSDPKLAMDLILQGINLPRSFFGNSIRIVSFGNPYRHDNYIDNFQRKWEIDFYVIEYSDEVAILFSTPTPDGLTCILLFCTYCEIETWLYDLKKFADLTVIPYYGTLEDWRGFLQNRERLYGLFKTANIDFIPGNSLHVDTEEFTFFIDNNLFEITTKMYLMMQFDYFSDRGTAKWGLRRISLGEEMRENYAVIFRYIKPPSHLSSDYQNSWKSFVNRQHPLTGIPFAQNGGMAIASVHSSFTEGSEYGYSLFLEKEGEVKATTMKEDLILLEKGLIFKQ